MQKTLVVHPYPGIGDLIWHIPYLRAIAEQSLNGRISVLARPACRAADVLSGESCIEEVIEHDYKRRDRSSKGIHDGMTGKLRIASQLRSKNFDRIVIFSDRTRYAEIAVLADIPMRYGYGFRIGQRLWLNQGPYIKPYAGAGSPVYDEASRFAVAHGFVSHAIVPKIQIEEKQLEQAGTQFAGLPRPRIAFAIGASEQKKNWGGTRFLVLAKRLLADGYGIIFVGGPAERVDAETLYTEANGLPGHAFRVLCQTSVMYSAAALKTCNLTIGNDTGALNLSAACDVPTLGLFGGTLPLQHDPIMRGITASSMDEISVDAVYRRATTLLSHGS